MTAFTAVNSPMPIAEWRRGIDPAVPIEENQVFDDKADVVTVFKAVN